VRDDGSHPAGSQRVVTVDVKQLVIYRKDADGQWRIARFSSNGNN
jgi:ketosteroid isomerase-like protein